MRIDESGRVGIGTTSQNRSLQIGDGSASANFGLNSSTSPNMYIARAGTSVGFIGTTLYNTGSGSDTELSIRGESAFGFWLGSSEKAASTPAR